MERFSNNDTMMEIIPIAFDSLGVRSMATFVETKDVKILIDPGAAIGPKRYSLPPHELELKKLKELTGKIKKFAIKADALVISHYHYDHYFPDDIDLYKNKRLFIKNPFKKINKSQEKRAKDFLNKIEGAPKEIIYSDGKNFSFGHAKTKIKFSFPCPHGDRKSKLGYVIMCSITNGREKIIHASDIQGPQVGKSKDWIISENPDILILSFFPTIFLGWRFSKKSQINANKNLIQIMERTNVKKIILEHHLLRDLYYKRKIPDITKRAEELNKEILTAAEFNGEKNNFLEAKRRILYSKPSS